MTPYESRAPLPGPTTPERRLQALATLADLPRWVEARGMLLDADCEVVEAEAHGHGFLVVHPVECLAVMCGEPGARAVRYALASMSSQATLLCEDESLSHAQEALPTWSTTAAALHELPPATLAEVIAGDAERAASERGAHAGEVVRLLGPADETLLGALPPGDLRQDLLREELLRLLPRAPIAATFIDGRPVAFCSAPYRTETLWDAGVDTLPEFRRRGLAGAAFRHLAAHLATRGLSPVWGAEADNQASLALAAHLGFVVTDALQVLTPGD